MSKDNLYGQFPRRLVDTRYAPGAIRFDKHIFRMVDISDTAPGTEINLGHAGEIALFADYPVDIIVGESSKVYEARTDLRLMGNITKVRVRRRISVGLGRLVIFAGTPSLGVTFKRESPLDKQPMNLSSANITWTGGSNNVSSLNQTLPVPGSVFGLPLEAYYIYNIHAKRSAGTIERLEIVADGISTVFDRLWEVPNGSINLTLPYPRRIAQDSHFTLTGSIEVGDTTVRVYYDAVLI